MNKQVTDEVTTDNIMQKMISKSTGLISDSALHILEYVDESIDEAELFNRYYLFNDPHDDEHNLCYTVIAYEKTHGSGALTLAAILMRERPVDQEDFDKIFNEFFDNNKLG